jgi:hypothetical protein
MIFTGIQFTRAKPVPKRLHFIALRCIPLPIGQKQKPARNLR